MISKSPNSVNQSSSLKRGNSVKWESISKAWISGAGASGVTFVDVEGQVFVLKGCSQVAEEIFASQLARRLGMQAPFTRVVETSSEESTIIKVY